MINDEKYDIPGINWLVHVLVENVGHNEWVDKTPEELEAYRLTLPPNMRENAYTMKVISHPIPDVPGVICITDSKPFIAAFNSDRAKQLFIQLSQRYRDMEREYYRAMGEMGAEKWIEAKDGNTPCCMANRGAAGLCSAGAHSCLLTSPALQYVDSVVKGYYSCNGGGGNKKPGVYYAVINGKQIEIKPSHWRHIPPAPEHFPKYEAVKEDVEKIRKAAGIQE